jgi:anti-sigma factor RsiW
MERRRRARLTPLSGELKAMVEWQPPDPTKQEKPRRRRREKRAPTTRRAVIRRGLLRLVVLLVGVSGTVVLIAWLVARHWNRSFEHALPTAFYFAAAGVGALAVLGGTGVGRSYRYSGGYGADASLPRQTAVNTSAFFGLLALFLFGLGLALDYVL